MTSPLSKLHTYSRPTTGLAWVREAERLLVEAYERPVDAAGREDAAHAEWMKQRPSLEEVKRRARAINEAPASIFGTPPELIPEGAEEFESEGMRALRFEDRESDRCEVRIVSKSRIERRWLYMGKTQWSGWHYEHGDSINALASLADAVPFLRYWLPRADEPIERTTEQSSPVDGDALGFVKFVTDEHGDLDMLDCRDALVVADSLARLLVEAVGTGDHSNPASISRDLRRIAVLLRSERARHAQELERERAKVRELEAELSEEREVAPYGYAIAGKEAEELRAGIEEILTMSHNADLQRLLDEVDARDSLACLTKQDKLIASLQSEVTRLTAQAEEARASCDDKMANLLAQILESSAAARPAWRDAPEICDVAGWYWVRDQPDGRSLDEYEKGDEFGREQIAGPVVIVPPVDPLPVALPESGEETPK
jgi:hypothetical protein